MKMRRSVGLKRTGSESSAQSGTVRAQTWTAEVFLLLLFCCGKATRNPTEDGTEIQLTS